MQIAGHRNGNIILIVYGFQDIYYNSVRLRPTYLFRKRKYYMVCGMYIYVLDFA